MKNERLRTALKEMGVYLWEVAECLGVSEATVTRMMRKELPEEEQSRIIALVEKEGKHD